MSLTTLLAIMKYLSRRKSAAVRDIADILSQKYCDRINIGKGDINPSLLETTQNTRCNVYIKTHLASE